MQRCCIAAGCNTKGWEGYSRSNSELMCEMDRNCKKQWMGWKGLTTTSLLCSRHFEHNCFITDVCYRDSIGIPMKKRLKPDSLPMVFPRSIQGGSSQPSTGLLVSIVYVIDFHFSWSTSKVNSYMWISRGRVWLLKAIR